MAGRIHALVVSLVVAGLRRAAPDAIDAAAADALLAQGAASGSVALGPYRAFLSDVGRRVGEDALLRAGAAIDGVEDPMLYVLLNSGSPTRLIRQEARLARYVHSRHRVAIDEEGERHLLLRHVATRAQPIREEHLVNCGIHMALLREIGCEGLRCRLPESGAPALWIVRDDEVTPPDPTGSAAVWHVEWDRFTATRRPMPGLDELLLRAAAPREVPEESGWADQVRHLMRSDLPHAWRLTDVADRLRISVRSLQRSLTREGTYFGALVEEVRVEEAARLLRESELTITAAGYACGFSDPSHLTRSFRRQLGVTPSAYRDAH